MLSPAERVILQATELPPTAESDGVDAAEYARQQLAQLSGASPDPIETQSTVPGSPADVADGVDPAEYARQQMAQLSGDVVPAAPVDAQPASDSPGVRDSRVRNRIQRPPHCLEWNTKRWPCYRGAR